MKISAGSFVHRLYPQKTPPALRNRTEFNSGAGWDFSLGLLLLAWMAWQARAWQRGGDEDTLSPCLARHPRPGVTVTLATLQRGPVVHGFGSPSTKPNHGCHHTASSTLTS